jgi:hypothetical protein
MRNLRCYWTIDRTSVQIDGIAARNLAKGFVMNTAESSTFMSHLESASSRRHVLRRLGGAALVVAVAAGGSIVRGPASALAAGSDFTVVRFVRLHLGDGPEGDFPNEAQAPFEGSAETLTFDCPNVDRGQPAVLTLETYDVTVGRSTMSLNGTELSAALRTRPAPETWNSHVVLIDSNVLQATDNRLVIQAGPSGGGPEGGQFDDFILDNIVVFYKTR